MQAHEPEKFGRLDIMVITHRMAIFPNHLTPDTGPAFPIWTYDFGNWPLLFLRNSLCSRSRIAVSNRVLFAQSTRQRTRSHVRHSGKGNPKASADSPLINFPFIFAPTLFSRPRYFSYLRTGSPSPQRGALELGDCVSTHLPACEGRIFFTGVLTAVLVAGPHNL